MKKEEKQNILDKFYEKQIEGNKPMMEDINEIIVKLAIFNQKYGTDFIINQDKLNIKD